MAPEQARSGRADQRADLFSLGAVLYQLCTGKLAFPGDNLMAVLMALAIDVPPPLRDLNPQVPAALADLIHTLLAKNPEDRPVSAAEVAGRLRAIGAAHGKTTEPRPVDPSSYTDEAEQQLVLHPSLPWVPDGSPRESLQATHQLSTQTQAVAPPDPIQPITF